MKRLLASSALLVTALSLSPIAEAMDRAQEDRKTVIYQRVMPTEALSPIAEAMDREQEDRKTIVYQRVIPACTAVAEEKFTAQQKAAFRNVLLEGIQSQNMQNFLGSPFVTSFATSLKLLVSGIQAGDEPQMRQSVIQFFNNPMVSIALPFAGVWCQSDQGQLDFNKLPKDSIEYSFATRGREFVLQNNLEELKALVNEAIPLLATPQASQRAGAAANLARLSDDTSGS